MFDNHIEELIFKYIHQNLTDGERMQLDEWLQQDPLHQAFFDQLTSPGYLEKKLKLYAKIDPGDAWDIVSAKALAASMPVAQKGNNKILGWLSLRRLGWTSAAALILVVLVTYIFKYSIKKPSDNLYSAETEIAAPHSNRAAIVLSDGSQVSLDSMNNGELAQQGDVKIIKLKNGHIAYKGVEEGKISKVIYNTLINPNGSRIINMELADGTRIWLNAGSSIRYPVAFSGNKRIVEISGEVYFEVTKDPEKQFIVNANGIETAVLGTHFNIYAYNNDPTIKVTLLEGRIRVTDNNQPSLTSLLKPGQQACINSRLKILNIDIDDVMAWKQGYFNFNGLGVKEIMHELERWYDVEVKFKGVLPEDKFYGGLNRSTSLGGVLAVLRSYNIQSTLDGRTIYISAQ